LLKISRFRRPVRGRAARRARARRSACETHLLAVHSARLAATSLVFLALLAASATSERIREVGPLEDSEGTPPPPRILWKSGAADVAPQADPSLEARRLLAEGKTRVLLQLREKPDRDTLLAAGIEILRYLPSDTWIVRLSEPIDWTAFGTIVRWAGEIPAERKIAPPLAEEGAAKSAGAVPLRVRFHDDVDVEEAAAILRAAGASMLEARTIVRVFEAILPAPAVEDLAARDEVLWIAPPLPPPVPANDGIRQSANIDSVHAAPYLLTGSGAKAGIWDGGRVDAHDDFSGRLTIADGGSPVSDHATHVAGTLAGSGARSAPYGGLPLQWRGAAPQGFIYSYDYYGDVPAEFGAAIGAHGIDLSSNSWVLDVDQARWGNCYLYGDYDGYAPEFDEIVAGYFGKPIVLVIAAGNERNDGDCGIDARSGYACMPPPATAKNAITVGAIHTNNSAMTSFSSYGPTDDGRVKPDLVAGGCQSTYDYSIWSTWPGNGYGATFYCGTSMAAPAVAGTALLLFEAWRSEAAAHPGALSGAPFPSTIKALLLGSADDLGNAGPDFRFGYGRMNAKRAVDFIRTSTIVQDSLADGEVRTWTFPVPAGLPSIRVTLAWDDPAGVPLAARALVNDLDLALLSPGGSTFYPYVLDPGNPAAAATNGADHRNNVEQVAVLSPQAGIWTARVAGTDVPVGARQRFSLAGIDARAPAAPRSFGASGLSDSSIALSWSAPSEPDAVGILLVRSTASLSWTPIAGTIYTAGENLGGGVVVVAETAGTSLDDSGLPSCTRFHYRAFAFDRNRNYSSPSSASSLTTGTCTAVPLGGGVPSAVRLHGARPNPFNATTRIRFDLPTSGSARLAIYDLAGRLVRVLLDEALPAGAYEETWDGRGNGGEEAASGIYFAELRSGSTTETVRLHLIR